MSKTSTKKNPKEQLFTTYWRTGERLILRGTDIVDALAKTGRHHNHLRLLSWYDNGKTDTHTYSVTEHVWVRRHSPSMARRLAALVEKKTDRTVVFKTTTIVHSKGISSFAFPYLFDDSDIIELICGMCHLENLGWNVPLKKSDVIVKVTKPTEIDLRRESIRYMTIGEIEGAVTFDHMFLFSTNVDVEPLKAALLSLAKKYRIVERQVSIDVVSCGLVISGKCVPDKRTNQYRTENWDNARLHEQYC